MKTLLSLLLILFALSPLTPLHAADPANPSEAWSISQGGKLYDNWAVELHTTPPETTHPSYPASGKKSGPATWRCKECHGWDYRGVEGAYASGSHYTGIRGVRDQVGRPVGEIVAVLRDATHRYNEALLPEVAARQLALFISRGQLDMASHIDTASRQPKGSATRGEGWFQTICANCHGHDGRRINFKEGSGEVEVIGTVATANPWETLHKLRNGQPDAPMVSLQLLDLQQQLDILSYAQTLPTR